MYKLCYFLLLSFISCHRADHKFIRKKIDNHDIIVRWYYYSYITSNSPDIVEVEKDSEIKELYKATGVILDVALKDRTIFLKLVEPSKNLVFTKNMDKEVFGYNIIVDTSGSYKELFLRPDAVRE